MPRTWSAPPGRELEAAAREAAWHTAQAERLAAEAERAAAALAVLEARPATDAPTGAAAAGEQEAIAAWESRVGELRTRRDRLAGDVAAHERARREAEGRRARAEAAVAMAEGRIAATERDLEALADRERAAGDERDTVAGELAAAASRGRRRPARRSRRSLPTTAPSARGSPRPSAPRRPPGSGCARRTIGPGPPTSRRSRRVSTSIRCASSCSWSSRVWARSACGTSREAAGVEVADLARPVGTRPGRRRRRDRGRPGRRDPEPVPRPADGAAPAEAGETAALEAALDLLAPRWADDAPEGELPSPGRLATLRRRFHELGAANPFAVDEYRAVRDRLETLDAQDKDLREAIGKTRALIADLDVLIATQFRTTFAALEVAFDERFRQLFGGGFAKLSLTDPTDLSATGIEITARPPGKKPQALSMLSGGERALTAVALLFAMLEVRPAPFCVLDEVDAALDEANVGRFTEALRASSPTRRSSSSSPTTAARSRPPTPCTGSPSATTRSAA